MTTTLTQFLIEERSRHPGATGALNGLILSVAVACKAIAARIARGPLTAGAGDEPAEALPASPSYHLHFVPVDEPSNLAVNLPVGSIFSILRGAEALQRGAQQVAAGYALYGTSTMFVVSVGDGVHGFTLERSLGEFLLTHPRLAVARHTSELAIDAASTRSWEAPVRRYVSECLAGTDGCRARDFNMRWVASLVAETHRVLVRGGVYLQPRHASNAADAGGLSLLGACNPIAMLVEQAGGRASTGRRAMLEVRPETPQQRVPLVFGTAEEVERIEAYHAAHSGEGELDVPLFNARGLFRDSAHA